MSGGDTTTEAAPERSPADSLALANEGELPVAIHTVPAVAGEEGGGSSHERKQQQ